MQTLTQEATGQPSSIHRPEPLAAAYFWLLAFFVVYCARPEDWIPGLYVVPLAKITGVCAVIALALSLGQARRLPREVLYLFLLFAQLCLTVPFSVWRGGAFNSVLEFSKIVVIVPVVVLAVSNLARLRWLIFTQTASVLVVAIVSLAKGQLRGGRLEGVLGGIYGNANDLALAIVLSIPFCLAFVLVGRSGFRKALWLFAAAVMTYALLRTASRGGLLAFVIAMGVLLWEFGIKGGRRYLLPLAGVIVLGGLLVAGRGVKERFAEMSASDLNGQGDTAAHASAVQRRQLLWRSLVMTAQHPLFGVGPGNFVVVSGVWRVAHNSFTELSAEGGLPALILFLLFFGRSFYNVQNAELLVRGQAEQTLLAGALRSSLVGFVIGALFISVEYNFFPYFLVAYTTALHAIAAKHASQKDSTQQIPDTPRQPEHHQEPSGATVTWADYQQGRVFARETDWDRG
jgi:O-antigen ligase